MLMAAKTGSEFEAFRDLDQRLVEAAKRIKVLTVLAWPETLFEEFIKGWKAKNPVLPKLEHSKVNYKKQISELNAIMKGSDRSHPVGNYLFQTAESYALAAEMLQSRGTADFTRLSIQIYGKPTDSIGAQGGSTHLTAADHFMETKRYIIKAYKPHAEEFCLSAEQVAEDLRKVLVPYFKDHPIEVVTDPELNAKAAAGLQRVRLRANTCFSSLDILQLLHHEGFVHLLTAVNGKAQPNLTSFSLGSPRTTRTQEGLATFAELHTSSMDLIRLQRLALRIRGVQMGLDGANFIELFRFFMESGQDEQESFQSAARIFRGGDPKGGVVFTKDVVYLQGLIFVHTFLRKTIQENKFHFAEYLFSGRLTLGDVVALEPFFQSGFIAPPRYEPPWLLNRTNLAAYLCYAVFANRINVGDFKLEDFAARQL